MFSRAIQYFLLLVGLLLLSFPGVVQEDAPAYASAYTGVVESIEGTTLIVSGLIVDGSSLPAATFVQIEVGTMVTFSGTLQQGVFIATDAALADGETPAVGTISFTGIIDAADGTNISVNGLVVDVSTVSAQTFIELQVGVLVTVVGSYQNGLVTVVTIVIVDTPPEPASNYIITYEGRVFDGTTTTFTYTVTGTGLPPALSHFDLQIPICSIALELVSYSPTEAVEVGVDPTTGIDGIKWDLPLGESESRTYSVTFQGDVLEGEIAAAVKNGDGFTIITVPGPSCETVEATPPPEVTPEITPEITPEVTPEITPSPEQTEIPTEIYIVIEGPVQVIVNNVIIIYGFEIELDDDDPILTVIQIGDIIRIEGVDTGTIIIASVIIIVNVEVYIENGEVWRGDNCQNPPPPWAPAEGWRRRCEGGGDNDDDDDDDDDDGGRDRGSVPDGDRLVICHVAQGNGQRQTITVGRNAWFNEHSRHGDTLGPCT